MITENTVLRTSEALSMAELDGEMVILDVESGHYYGVNRVGTRILEISEQPIEVREIIDVLLGTFDVERARLEADVFHFLTDLHSKGLIVVDK